MRYLAAVVILALAGFGLTSPALAKTGDPAWVKCIWQNASASATNWLKMTPPNYQSQFMAPNSLLGLRLVGICASGDVDPIRPNRQPNWKQLASVLKKGQPDTAPRSDTSESSVLLCESGTEEGGWFVVFKAAIVRRQGDVKLTAYEQYFDNLNGTPVALPQDLRVIPQEGTKVQEKCRAISDAGTLIDA